MLALVSYCHSVLKYSGESRDPLFILLLSLQKCLFSHILHNNGLCVFGYEYMLSVLSMLSNAFNTKGFFNVVKCLPRSAEIFIWLFILGLFQWWIKLMAFLMLVHSVIPGINPYGLYILIFNRLLHLLFWYFRFLP